MNLKPWQIGVIVLAFVVCGASLAYMSATSGEVKLNREFYMVDVESGDLYHVDMDRYTPMLPARHPQTGKIQLVRIHRGDGGKWVVNGRDLGSLDALDQGVKVQAINPDTGELLSPAKSPVEYQRPKS